MGLLIDFLLERSRQRLSFQTPQTRRPPVTYDLTQEKEKKPALFGVDPSEAFGGLDWAFHKPPAAVPQGVVRTDTSKPIVNRSGSTVGLKPLRTYAPSELQETRRKLSYQPTDQKPPKRGSVVNWDGKVRVGNKMKGFESSRPEPGEKTPSAVHAEELKKFPYDFSV